MKRLSDATIPELRRRVADLCQGHLLISRDEAGLRALRDELQGVDTAELSMLRGRFRQPAWELHCLCVTGLLMIEAAARRDESRGSHYRSDHPTRRGDAGRPTILQRGPDGGILFSVSCTD
jgi:L-aspartate oxidase